MKLVTGIIVLVWATALSCAAYVAGEHAHTPKDGGVVVEVKDVDYELVAKPDLVQLYVTAHGKPIDLKDGSAKVNFLTGSEKTEVSLAPAGDKFVAKGSFKVGVGSKAVAVVTLPGKSVQTVRFTLK